ncbi:unnamed protein product [Penicillium olsonii]|nr:unnamed protein product [Penicillium olsonii]
MFAKRYVLLTKPMIILTLGTKASSSAKSGFHHPFGYPATQLFTEKVGKLELVNCEDTPFIQVACFHPGKGRFCRNPGTFSKVFDMTLWILLLTVTICIKTEQAFRNQTRKVWCQNILATVENKLLESGFYKCFDRLKAKLHSEGPRSQSILTFRGRSRLGIATRTVTDRFLFIGFALGLPMSAQRRQQVRNLWDLNISELHNHIRREHKSLWWTWACGIAEGTSFFANATVSSVMDNTRDAKGRDTSRQPSKSRDQHAPQEEFACGRTFILQTESSKPEVSWIRPFLAPLNERTPGEAVRLLTSAICECLRPLQMADAHRKSKGRISPQFLERWHGAEVYAWRNGSFAIYWNRGERRNVTFTLRPPLSDRNNSIGVRKFIFFTPHGIDIQDESGTPCRAQTGTLGSKNLATFPVCRLHHCQDNAHMGNQLIELWEKETGLSWRDTIADIASSPEDRVSIAERDFKGPSLGLIHLGWKRKVLLEPFQATPVPADASWLLWKCLLKYWPHGGILFIGDPLKWRRTDHFWGKFREFLASGEYRDHPHFTSLSAWAHDLAHPRKTAQLKRNLELICTIKSQRKIQCRDYARKRVEKKDVKIAGTELNISSPRSDISNNSDF